MTPTCHPERVYRAKGMCVACYSSTWRKAHPGLHEKYHQRYVNKDPAGFWERRRWIKLRYQYGVTKADFEGMLERQDNKCSICLNVLKPGHATHVDHDHVTGCVRGLLCTKCNTAIGFFAEDIGTLNRAIQYLARYKP